MAVKLYVISFAFAICINSCLSFSFNNIALPASKGRMMQSFLSMSLRPNAHQEKR